MQLLGVCERHLRFGFSPARECLRGIAVLLHPRKRAEQTPWLREARRRLPRDVRRAIEEVRFFFEPRAIVFPFLWTFRRGRTFERELGRLRSSLGDYRDAVVRRLSGRRLIGADELRSMRERSWYEAAAREYALQHPGSAIALERFVRSPSASLAAFCRTIDAFHAHVFLPAWTPIEERLSADVAMRERILQEYGTAALLRTLSPEIIVRRVRTGASIELPGGDDVIRLDDRAVVELAPSFFSWPNYEAYVVRTERGLRCTIQYPVPPLTANVRRIEDAGFVANACAALSDPVRLRAMELLAARDLSTRELAGYLELDESVASRHLGALLKAGLVRRSRSGYFVMYALERKAVSKLTTSLSTLS